MVHSEMQSVTLHNYTAISTQQFKKNTNTTLKSLEEDYFKTFPRTPEKAHCHCYSTIATLLIKLPLLTRKL